MKPSSWAVARFGDNAEAVVREVPRALARAHAFAADAQAHSGTDRQDPYGHTLKNTQHEQIVAGLGALTGAQLIRPRGASYDLVRFPEQRTLLYPWRYGNSLSDSREAARMRVSDFRADLLGPTPGDNDQLALDQAHLSPEQLAKQLAQDDELMEAIDDLSHVVLAPYVSNERGLLAIGLGAAKLVNSKGDLAWQHYEPLSLGGGEEPGDATGGTRPAGPRGPSTYPHLRVVDPASGAFDDTPLDDDLGISARPYPEEAPSPEVPGEPDRTGDGSGDQPAGP